MRVVTSFKVKESIKKDLEEKFPAVLFSFFNNIDEASSMLKEADILLSYGEDLERETLEKAKKLKWIMVLSAGLDKLPFEVIKEKGILVTNVRGIHKVPMGEYAISMMLQTARKAKELIGNESNEVWDKRVKMTELHGSTLSILGTGAIGEEIARLAKAFNMNVMGVNRSGRDVENFDHIFKIDQIDIALSQSDFVVSVLPSTPETKALLTYRSFEAMKENAVFINIGRGDLVEEKVLLSALENSEISHAVLDVFENEPLAESHPFWEMENVTVTPHISGISRLYQERGFKIFERNLESYLSDVNEDMVNTINLDRGY